ncbi:MAG: type II toxin-antitoxin system HicA family toxin [Planctomycetota bacterium]
MKLRDLEIHLKNHNCRFLRHGSRHDFWINSDNGSLAPVPRHREVKTYTARNICRQLGIPQPDKV